MAHPDLVPVAQEVFDSVMLGKNQICKQLPSFNVTNVELTAVPDGKRTEKGLRYNISITLGKYLFFMKTSRPIVIRKLSIVI